MKKQFMDRIIIINVCVFVLLLLMFYKVLTYEDRISAVELSVEGIALSAGETDDMPFEIVPETSSEVNETEKKAFYKIYITGYVNSPGIYTMEEGSRIYDLLEKAGGSIEGAALDSINLAAFVEDGRHVHIPSTDEKPAENADTFIDEEPQAQSSLAEYEKSLYKGIVNINTANSGELMSLPGIGPAIAQNIIDYRSQNGGFKTKEEIKNVSRIGDATYKNISDMITVE